MKSHSERLAAHFASLDTLKMADVEPAWDVVAKRRARARACGRLRVGGALAVGATTVAVLVGEHGVSPRPRAPTAAESVRPLALADGRPLPESLGDGASRIELDDGSRLEIARGARLLAKASAPSEVDLALSEGFVTFDVKPGGPRLWHIDAGHVRVRVLGTRFSVLRADARVEVTVERGAVQVESDALPGRARTLGPGELVRLDGRASEASAAMPPPAPTMPVRDLPAAKADVTQTLRGPSTTRRPTLPMAKGPGRIASGNGGSDQDPMARADETRRSGRPRDAATILATVAESSDARASLAAFTLGRVASTDLHDDRAGAMWFERAHVLGLPAALDEEALAMAAACHARAGAQVEARRVAALYRALFPDGTKLPRTQPWPGD